MYNKEKITEILKSKLDVQFIEIIDESFKHAGHNAAAQKGGTHLELFIVSKDFAGKTLVQRHRIINDILKPAFQAGLHALSIKALSPDEYKK